MGLRKEQAKMRLLSAEAFIKRYLRHSDKRGDSIPVGGLYDQYTESTKQSIGKKLFNQMLMVEGFQIANGGGNQLTVYYIRSGWLS